MPRHASANSKVCAFCKRQNSPFKGLLGKNKQKRQKKGSLSARVSNSSENLPRISNFLNLLTDLSLEVLHPKIWLLKRTSFGLKYTDSEQKAQILEAENQPFCCVGLRVTHFCQNQIVHGI